VASVHRLGREGAVRKCGLRDCAKRDLCGRRVLIMPAQSVPYLAPQEYLEIEENAEYKSEYFRGQTWPLGGAPHGMAGGKFEHSGPDERSANSGQSKGPLHLRRSLHGLRQADTCGKIHAHQSAGHRRSLSSTTETNDRGLKFTQYVQDRIAGRN